MGRQAFLVIILVIAIAVAAIIPFGISRGAISQKVDLIPTGPARPSPGNHTSQETTAASVSNSSYAVVNNKTAISQLKLASLLPAPVDPRAGRADRNVTAIAAADKLFDVTSNGSHFVRGTSGNALQFHAYYEDYFSYENSSSLSSPTLTVSFWMMRDPNDQNYGHFVSYFNPTSHSGWYFDTGNSTDQSIRFIVTNTNGTLYQTQDVKLQIGHWEQIVGVFDGSTVAIYGNGSLASSVRFSGTYNPSPAVPLRIAEGSYCNSCVPTGLTIDELQIYGKGAPAYQIAARWNSSQPLLNQVPLTGYWKFDNNLVNQVRGDSGSIATLVGGMAAAPDGRVFFTEKNTGEIRILQNNRILADPFATINDVFPTIMYGLLGIAVDPDFESNHFVYAYYTSFDNESGLALSRVVRFTDQNNTGSSEKIIFDKIPAFNGMHTGGGLGFGPDGKLYVTVGDGYLEAPAQNVSSLLGKTLRINKDGSIPADNPFPNSPVFNYGHRNVYGIAFDNRTGTIISTENGVDIYDQVNLEVKAGNYGWPNLRRADTNPELSNSTMVDPILVYFYTIAPTQAVFYDKAKFPQLTGMFLFGSYNRGEIFGLKMDPDGKHVAEQIEIKLPQNTFTDPVTSITVAQDGGIYFGGHHIYRLSDLSLQP